jgi:hypothetical protein
MSYITSKIFYFLFKRLLSQEEYETGFSVLTITELILLVEFTKSCKDGLRTFNLMEQSTMSYKLQLQANEVMSFEIQATSYER